MKTRIGLLLFTLGTAAFAQSSSGYVFFAPGGVTSSGYTSMTLHTGGGVDAHLAKGVGLNLELGALGPKESFREAVGVFSPGATYKFLRGERKVEPFVAGGYSLMFREGHGNLFYFGGGVNYWMARRVGLRLEFRDHVYREATSSHFWGFRMAVAFR